MTTASPFDPNVSLAPDVEVIEDALFIPIGEGDTKGILEPAGVYRADDSFVENSICWRMGTQAATSKPDLVSRDDVPVVKGTYIFGGLIYAHFGHFLCESLGRLWAKDFAERKIDGVVYAPKKPRLAKNAKEQFGSFFQQFGYQDAPMVPRTPVRFERLIVAPQGWGTVDMIEGAPEFRAFMKRTFGRDVSPRGGKKLYIARTELFSKRGRILGEEFIVKMLEQDGYEIFHPQNHTLAEQIAHYKAADYIISMDCSALHLAAFFSRLDQKVAILNRREGDLDEFFVRQYEAFSSITPLVVNELLSSWSPEGVRVKRTETFGVLDFTAVQKSLKDAGFIGDGPAWPTIEGRRLARVIGHFEARLETKLVQVE